MLPHETFSMNIINFTSNTVLILPQLNLLGLQSIYILSSHIPLYCFARATMTFEQKLGSKNSRNVLPFSYGN